MCTVILLRRPGHRWPLLLAANRDEMRDRPSSPPGRHWPERPEIVAGLDRLAGGSWLGLNDQGIVAAILNRSGTLGPSKGKRSRGELVLDALDYADAAEAAAALGALDPNAYRPFNLVIADNRDAFWLAHRGEGAAISVQAIQPGLAMLTARDLHDRSSPRIRRYHDRFAAATPDPESDDWRCWQVLLEDTEADPALGPESAMRFMLPGGFGTLSSALIALAAPGLRPGVVWRSAGIAGQPSPWAPISLA